MFSPTGQGWAVGKVGEGIIRALDAMYMYMYMVNSNTARYLLEVPETYSIWRAPSYLPVYGIIHKAVSTATNFPA